MADLTKAREYADPWGGVEQEIAPERVKQWGRDIRDRPVSIGLPGMYFTAGKDPQGRRRLLQSEEAPKGAATFDPMLGLITEAQGIKQVTDFASRRAATRLQRGMPKEAAAALKQTDIEDFTSIIKQFPKKMLDKIRKIYFGERHSLHGHVAGAVEHHPGLTSSMDDFSVWLNTRFADPSTLAHEGGHVVSSMLGEWAEQAGRKTAFGKLRNTWGRMKHDSQSLELYLQKAGNTRLAERVYNVMPDEVFARRFDEAIAEGIDFREAIKFGVHEVRANMKYSKEAIADAIDWLNKNKDMSMTTPHYFGKFRKYR